MNKQIQILFIVAVASLFSFPASALTEASSNTASTVTNVNDVAEQAPKDINDVEIVYSQGELEQLLAPIALYPDSLLTHILIASTYPLEIIEADRWLKNHTGLDADQVVEQAQDKDWDPSVKALLPFAQVVSKLSEEINWTKQIGDAFLEAEEQVLASIQTLRAQADEAGNLEKMENTTVTRVEKTIVIEPATPEVIYVPYYDTRVVYGPWYWHHYPPVYWGHPHHLPYYTGVHHHSPFYWHSGVHVSVGILFGSFHWHNHHVVVHHDHHYYRHHGGHHRGHNKHHKKHSSHGKKHYANGPKKHVSSERKRWKHEPSHRKGVAYRSNKTAKHYKSNRYSVQHSKRLRAQEDLRAVNYDRSNSFNNAFRGKQSSSLTRQTGLRTDTGKKSVDTAKRNNRGDINKRTTAMRQESFKQKLSNSPANRNTLSKTKQYSSNKNSSKNNKNNLNRVNANTSDKVNRSSDLSRNSDFKRNSSTAYKSQYTKTTKALKQGRTGQLTTNSTSKTASNVNRHSKSPNKAFNNDLSKAYGSAKNSKRVSPSTVQRQATPQRQANVQTARNEQRKAPATVNKSYRSEVRKTTNYKSSSPVTSSKAYRSSSKVNTISRSQSRSSGPKMSAPRLSNKSMSRSTTSRSRMSKK